MAPKVAVAVRPIGTQLVLCLWMCASGCVGSQQEIAGAEAPIVYGADDRMDVYEHPDEGLRRLATESVVALVPSWALDMGSPDHIRIRTNTLGEEYELCSDQRFRDQPTAATCSGTLIDDDLVLTAGHCVTTQEQCEQLRFVFNYYYDSEGKLHEITRGDVYSCRDLVVSTVSGERGVLDYAVVQLDRPVGGTHRPATVRHSDTAMAVNASVVTIGFGSGIPAKIDNGGTVLSSHPALLDYFIATTDTFAGNSGSGVFNARRELVGILVRGNPDYRERGMCNVVNSVAANGGSLGGEGVTYVARAIEELCDSGWPSGRLCETSATCGDARCTGTESVRTCADDCTPTSCGDGTCQPSEELLCPSDCAVSLRPEIPEGWTCRADSYAAFDGCDCNCGTFDPDCDDSWQHVYNCAAGELCTDTGSCAPDPTRISGWSCPIAWYGSNNGCDCECGLADPDCDDGAQEVFGCEEASQMCVVGRCDTKTAAAEDVAAEVAAMSCSTTTRHGGVSVWWMLIGLALLSRRSLRR